MIIVKIPNINYKTSSGKTNYFELILILLLFSILIRSFIGSVLIFPWKSNIPLAIILTLGVFLGKALGGIFADRFGWIKVALFSLLISAPVLAFYSLSPIAAIAGIFLFNMTMPITLVAISNILPGKPGFSFGLTCLALIFGTLLVYLGTASVLNNLLILLIIIVSVIVLYFGLRLSKNLKAG
jgi:FSR family fosmidomycin resistance protein-like MFS transporter